PPPRSPGPHPPPGEASPTSPRPPPPKSETDLPTSGAAAGRSAVEALVTGAIAHHERAAVGTARRVRLRAEGDRMPADRVERRPAGEADRVRPPLGACLRRGTQGGAHRAGRGRR